MDANTNSHSSTRNPKRISCSASAEFIRPPQLSQPTALAVLARLVEHDAGVAHPDDVAVAQ